MPSQLALLGELFSLAEKQLEVTAEHLVRTVSLLEGEDALVAMFIAYEEADPPLGSAELAAAYGAWIIRHKPFPRDNREIGFRFMRLMLDRAEKPWLQLEDDAYVVEAKIESLETGSISVAEFVDWVCLRVRVAEDFEAP